MTTLGLPASEVGNPHPGVAGAQHPCSEQVSEGERGHPVPCAEGGQPALGGHAVGSAVSPSEGSRKEPGLCHSVFEHSAAYPIQKNEHNAYIIVIGVFL